MKTALIVADLHVPFQDNLALELIGKVASRVKPERVIIAGDLYDFYNISKFDRDPARTSPAVLANEQTSGRIILTVLGRMASHEVIFLLGNHEERFRKYLWRYADKLTELREMSGEHTLGFARLFARPMHGPQKVRLWTGRDGYTLGKLNIRHGTMYGKPSSVVGRTALRYPGRNVVVAHNHSMGFTAHRGAGKTWGYWSCGHLSNPAEMDWLIEEPDWQQGFLVACFDESGKFSVEQIPIFAAQRRRSCIFRGELIEARE